MKNYLKDKDEYKNFSSYIKSLFGSNYKLNPEIKKLLFLFYDEHNYMEKIRGKLANGDDILNQQIFEIILYGFRFCINTIINNTNNNNDDLLFASFLKENGIDMIKKSLIPGINGIESLRLNALEDIENHFKNFEDDYGCYVCSCGYYHYILLNGFPFENIQFNCPYCNLSLGWDWIDKCMINRQGYYRIFKNEEHIKEQIKKFNIKEEKFSYIFKDDYINKINNEIKNKLIFGFNSIPQNFFKNEYKNIRKLSDIGYRLLNFISYIHLFFGYCLDYISQDNLNNCLIQNMDIIKIIETDWHLLRESLERKNISSIQIFMNMIFNRLSKLIKECKTLTTEEEREKFENEVELLIENCIENYKTFSDKYITKNKEQLSLENNDLKTLITELIPISKEIYQEKEYPMFKYFRITKYKSKEDLLYHMSKKEKYPLLNQIISNKSELNLMKNLPSFNEFTNYMVEKYSYRISRDDAKKKILSNEEIFKNPEFKKKFDNFLKVWDEIKNYAKQYKSKNEMKVKNLSSKDPIIYFLNDNCEVGNGMYLASACQNFIFWQNNFLQKIINSNICEGILNYYINNIKRKIPLQNAKSGQILLIEKRFEKSNYIDLNDIIYFYSERNIFNKNGTLNYNNYNSFIYDYDAIEEELGKIILPGVCQFENEEHLNFITFCSEGFRGGRSQIFIEFSSKYPQKPLSYSEKNNIFKYINKKFPKNYGFKDFFGSIQMLIFFCKEIGNIVDNIELDKIINKPQPYLKFSEDFKNFFSNDEYKLNQLKIDKIMDMFFFIEHFCFKRITETLHIVYKREIPDNIKNEIINKLVKKGKQKDIITIKDLGAAVRRFITRYLAGNLESINISEDRELIEELYREDLWTDKIVKNSNLEEIISGKLKEFNLKVGQAYSLYELIGEEDKNLIKEYLKKDEEKKFKKEKKQEGENKPKIEKEKIKEKENNEKQNHKKEIKKIEKEEKKGENKEGEKEEENIVKKEKEEKIGKKVNNKKNKELNKENEEMEKTKKEEKAGQIEKEEKVEKDNIKKEILKNDKVENIEEKLENKIDGKYLKTEEKKLIEKVNEKDKKLENEGKKEIFLGVIEEEKKTEKEEEKEEKEEKEKIENKAVKEEKKKSKEKGEVTIEKEEKVVLLIEDKIKKEDKIENKIKDKIEEMKKEERREKEEKGKENIKEEKKGEIKEEIKKEIKEEIKGKLKEKIKENKEKGEKEKKELFTINKQFESEGKLEKMIKKSNLIKKKKKIR